MVAGKGARWFSLPEDPCTRPDEVVVEQPLVEASLIPLSVDAVERLSAPVYAKEPVVCLALRRFEDKLLQCVALNPLGFRVAQPL